MGTKVAWEMPGLQTFISANNMSAHVGRVAAMSGNGTVFTSSAKTDDLLGIIVDGGFSAGSQVSIACCPGMIVQGESVAAIGEMAAITVSGGGKCASAATASNVNAIGFAISAATASGQLVRIVIQGARTNTL